MSQWLIIMEAHSKAPIYEVLLDVLERRLGARRILRTARVIEASSAQSVSDSLIYYRPFNDGLLILPFGEPRVEKNLRGEQPASRANAAAAEIAVLALGQETPK